MGTRVLLVDDHPVIRLGLRVALAKHGRWDVAGESDNGRQAVGMASSLRPDVVIMDVMMPVVDGIESTALIRRNCPNTRVVALSMHADEYRVSRMLAAGACAYVTKNSDVAELVKAMEIAVAGGSYLSPAVATVVSGYVNRRKPVAGQAGTLSDRERQVLQLLAEGLSAKGIGMMLHVSSRTIDSHRQRIMRELGAASVAELTKHAIRMGLTTVQV